MVAAIFLISCQRIGNLGRLMIVLVAGVLLAVGLVIVLGIRHFDSSLITLPEEAFKLDGKFLSGLSVATSIAVYDYLGYYNICHMGEEVRTPAKTIPRSVLISIVVVAAIYASMNLAFMGVVPWQEMLTEGTMASTNIAGAFMTKLWGDQAARYFTGLIIWTCLAGLFAMTLGYSRILYAAAKNGDFFSFFTRLHPTRSYPWAALALLCALTAIFCFIPLKLVIEGAVVVQDPDHVHRANIRRACHATKRQTSHAIPYVALPPPQYRRAGGVDMAFGIVGMAAARADGSRLRQRACGVQDTGSASTTGRINCMTSLIAATSSAICRPTQALT